MIAYAPEEDVNWERCILRNAGLVVESQHYVR